MNKQPEFRDAAILKKLKKDGNPLVKEKAAGLVSGTQAVPNSKKTIRTFELSLPFKNDKIDLGVDADPQLDEIAQMLKSNPQLTARIECHTDKTNKSNASYSPRLTERRAQTVLKYLAKTGGIETNRMTAVGAGFASPKAPNDPDSGNPENRRIEVHIQEDP